MLEIKIAREKVLAEGRAEGRAEGIAEGRAEGIAEGRAEGIAEGRAEGIAEGRAEEKLANARSLKVNGVPVDVIVKSLGLTEEEVLLL
jgi:flagellar biosynthesis/type III secretory pathway protein FliH